MPHKTIEDAYKYGRQTLKEHKDESAALHARLLLMHVLAMSHEDFICAQKNNISAPQLAQYKSFLQAAAEGKPVSKIIGSKEFYGLDFIVSEEVLDPRPETEIIVDKLLAIIEEDDVKAPHILDMGTGSGCIPISLLKNHTDMKATALDISPKALDIARENAQKHGVSDRIDFVESDWGANCEGVFDYIVSNPPYIETHTIESLDENVRNYDPILALDGGADGFDAYKKIFNDVKRLIRPQGKALLEIGYNQGVEIQRIAKLYGFAVDALIQDFSGHNRIIVISTGKK